MSNQKPAEKGKVFPMLETSIRQFIGEFDRIDPDRRKKLLELAAFVSEKLGAGQTARLNFICTHNSRRSHMAQLWAQAAAYYYRVERVDCFSGGTEATAFNPRAVEAMRKMGFSVLQTSQGNNPFYEVRFSDDGPSMKIFSKRYNHPFNPFTEFAAIMTCSHADENCPVVTGASKRISITYDDPKDFDGTPQEEVKYQERAQQIGREMVYTFAQVK